MKGLFARKSPSTQSAVGAEVPGRKTLSVRCSIICGRRSGWQDGWIGRAIAGAVEKNPNLMPAAEHYSRLISPVGYWDHWAYGYPV